MEIHIGNRVADVTLVNKDGNHVELTIDGKPCTVDIVMAENGSCSILHDGNSYNAELIRGEGGKSYDVNMFYRCGCSDMSCFSLDPQPVTEETPCLYNLEITDCRGYDSRSSAAMIVGLPEKKVSNVRIRDCFFSVASEGLRPVSESDMYLGLPEIEDRGIRLRFVENLDMENVHVEGAGKEVILED